MVHFVKKKLLQYDLAYFLATEIYDRFVLPFVSIFRRYFPSPNAILIHSFEQLDQLLDQWDEAYSTDSQMHRSQLARLVFRAPEVQRLRKMNPFSSDYKVLIQNIHRRISKKDYDVGNEGLPTENLPQRLRWQTPYGQPASVVGSYLMGYGWLIKTLDLPIGAKILEVGGGEGGMSAQFVRMGYHLTCIEVSPGFARLIEACLQGITESYQKVQVLNLDIMKFETEEKFDAIVFFESFHHILEHDQLLKKLRTQLTPRGVIAFGAEPIHRHTLGRGVPPWGLNLSGEGLRTIRKFGWMELVFTEKYFHSLLEKHGLQGRRYTDRTGQFSDVILAKPKKSTFA